MSKSKELSLVVTHTTIFVPGVGQLGPTFTVGSGATDKCEKMTLEDGMVDLKTRGTVRQKSVNILVPISNTTHMVVKDQALAKDNKTAG